MCCKDLGEGEVFRRVTETYGNTPPLQSLQERELLYQVAESNDVYSLNWANDLPGSGYPAPPAGNCPEARSAADVRLPFLNSLGDLAFRVRFYRSFYFRAHFLVLYFKKRCAN